MTGEKCGRVSGDNGSQKVAEGQMLLPNERLRDDRNIRRHFQSITNLAIGSISLSPSLPHLFPRSISRSESLLPRKWALCVRTNKKWERLHEVKFRASCFAETYTHTRTQGFAPFACWSVFLLTV